MIAFCEFINGKNRIQQYSYYIRRPLLEQKTVQV